MMPHLTIRRYYRFPMLSIIGVLVVLASCIINARAEIPTITLELTGPEAQFVANLLDSATRSGGIAVSKNAMSIYVKIEDAVQKVQATANEAAHKAEIDAAVKAAIAPSELKKP